MGEFDMYRQAGTTPNFTDIARRYGMNRHTVAKYWKAAARWRTRAGAARAGWTATGRS